MLGVYIGRALTCYLYDRCCSCCQRPHFPRELGRPRSRNARVQSRCRVEINVPQRRRDRSRVLQAERTQRDR
jgi:hypothetical protein